MKKALIAVGGFLGLACAFGGQQPAEDFPIAELKHRDGSRLVHLHSSYGFVAKWEADGRPSFFLYDKLQSRVSATRDLRAFLDGLSRFPDGAEVAWVNTCAAPLHYGMPVEILSAIQDALKKRGFKMAGIEENNFVLCTCEATNLWFFTSPRSIKKGAKTQAEVNGR